MLHHTSRKKSLDTHFLKLTYPLRSPTPAVILLFIVPFCFLRDRWPRVMSRAIERDLRDGDNNSGNCSLIIILISNYLGAAGFPAEGARRGKWKMRWTAWRKFFRELFHGIAGCNLAKSSWHLRFITAIEWVGYCQDLIELFLVGND